MYRLTVTLPDEVGRFVKQMKRGERIKYLAELIRQDMRRAKRSKALEDFLAQPPLEIGQDPTELLRRMREAETLQMQKRYEHAKNTGH